MGQSSRLGMCYCRLSLLLSFMGDVIMGRMKEIWQQEQDKAEVRKAIQQSRNQARYKRASEDADIQADARDIHEFTDLVRLAEYRSSLGELIGD